MTVCKRNSEVQVQNISKPCEPRQIVEWGALWCMVPMQRRELGQVWVLHVHQSETLLQEEGCSQVASETWDGHKIYSINCSGHDPSEINRRWTLESGNTFPSRVAAAGGWTSTILQSNLQCLLTAYIIWHASWFPTCWLFFQEFRQYLCLCEDSEETEVSEEIERLYKAIDGDVSSSSSEDERPKKQTKDAKDKKVKKVWVAFGVILIEGLCMSFVLFFA